MMSFSVQRITSHFTRFLSFLQKTRMDHTGLLRRFFLLSTVLNAVLLLGFIVYIYHDCYLTVQKESGQLAARLQKVFLLEVESTLEEMMVFGKEQLQKPHDPRIASEKTLFFN